MTQAVARHNSDLMSDVYGLMGDVKKDPKNFQNYIRDSLNRSRKNDEGTILEDVNYSLASIIQTNKGSAGYRWESIRKRIDSIYNRPLVFDELTAFDTAVYQLRYNINPEEQSREQSSDLRNLIDHLETKYQGGMTTYNWESFLITETGCPKRSQMIKKVKENIREYAKADSYQDLNRIAESLRDVCELAERNGKADKYKNAIREVEELMNEAREAQLHPKKKRSIWSWAKEKVSSFLA